tara:strand:+ start:736 stop:894 length:159 start_codon:yes stop_codon:yes gene_type:complete
MANLGFTGGFGLAPILPVWLVILIFSGEPAVAGLGLLISLIFIGFLCLAFDD